MTQEGKNPKNDANAMWANQKLWKKLVVGGESEQGKI